MKPLHTRIGGSAEGSRHFFERKAITRKIRRKLRDGEHLLITAPRRIGKTSLLKQIRDTPEEGQIVIYLIVQSVDSIDAFNKNLFNTLIKNQDIYNSISGYLKRSGNAIKKIVSQIRGLSIEGVELNGEDTLNYFEELKVLFEELTSHEKQIIIFIDEFPDVISNIGQIDQRDAIKLLQQQREIRTQFKASQIQFVYTGSTGLINVVKKIDKVHLTNDLAEVRVPPLTDAEAKELMSRLILGKQIELKSFAISDDVIEYTVKKIHWLLPYFIQIVVDTLFDDHDEFELGLAPSITCETVDNLFDMLVKTHSNHSAYFENWEARLKYIGKKDHKLAIKTLDITALQGEISYEAFYNLAVKLKIKNPRFVLDVLQYDGYITESEDGGRYGFNSPLLRQWWANNVR